MGLNYLTVRGDNGNQPPEIYLGKDGSDVNIYVKVDGTEILIGWFDGAKGTLTMADNYGDDKDLLKQAGFYLNPDNGSVVVD